MNAAKMAHLFGLILVALIDNDGEYPAGWIYGPICDDVDVWDFDLAIRYGTHQGLWECLPSKLLRITAKGHDLGSTIVAKLIEFEQQEDSNAG